MNVFLTEVGPVVFPPPAGISINMLPFRMGDPDSIPKEFRGYVPLIDACGLENEQIGRVGFLSIQESSVTASHPTQRRPGIHTDRHPSVGWGGGWGSGGMSDVR